MSHRKPYSYDQKQRSCPYCHTNHPGLPISYQDNDGLYRTANYEHCVICHKVIRRWGYTLEEFTLRQLAVIVRYNRSLRYFPGENVYYAMDTRFPYPPMTYSAIMGRSL